RSGERCGYVRSGHRETESSESRNRRLMESPAILDTDTLSELARGNPQVTSRSTEYLSIFGRLTTTAVTVFERIRGYRMAIREGRRFEAPLRAFEAFVSTCFILPFDHDAARVAGGIWSAVARSRRYQWEDVLIAA